MKNTIKKDFKEINFLKSEILFKENENILFYKEYFFDCFFNILNKKNTSKFGKIFFSIFFIFIINTQLYSKKIFTSFWSWKENKGILYFDDEINLSEIKIEINNKKLICTYGKENCGTIENLLRDINSFSITKKEEPIKSIIIKFK